jgi:hypothetical protein
VQDEQVFIAQSVHLGMEEWAQFLGIHGRGGE